MPIYRELYRLEFLISWECLYIKRFGEDNVLNLNISLKHQTDQSYIVGTIVYRKSDDIIHILRATGNGK